MRILYVALTRAIEKIIIFADMKKDFKKELESIESKLNMLKKESGLSRVIVHKFSKYFEYIYSSLYLDENLYDTLNIVSEAYDIDRNY